MYFSLKISHDFPTFLTKIYNRQRLIIKISENITRSTVTQGGEGHTWSAYDKKVLLVTLLCSVKHIVALKTTIKVEDT